MNRHNDADLCLHFPFLTNSLTYIYTYNSHNLVNFLCYTSFIATSFVLFYLFPNQIQILELKSYFFPRIVMPFHISKYLFTILHALSLSLTHLISYTPTTPIYTPFWLHIFISFVSINILYELVLLYSLFLTHLPFHFPFYSKP